MNEFSISKDLVKKYTDTLAKLLNGRENYVEDDYSVTLSPLYSPPYFCFIEDEAHFALLRCREEMIRLKRLEELVKNDFRINLGRGVEISLKLGVAVREMIKVTCHVKNQDWDAIKLKFSYSSFRQFKGEFNGEQRFNRKIQPAVICFSYYEDGNWMPPEEYLPLFPKRILYIKDSEKAKEACIKIVESMQKFLLQREKDYRERIKFLKQPVSSYEELFKDNSHNYEKSKGKNDKTVTREKMFANFFKEIERNFSELGEVLSDKFEWILPGSYAFYRWKLPEENDDLYEEKITKAMKSIRNLKYLFSCVDPSLVRLVLNPQKDWTFRITKVNGYIKDFLVSTCYHVEGQKDVYKFPFVLKTKGVGDGSDLVKLLSDFEKFLSQCLKKRQLEKQVKNFQIKNKNVMI